jgi:superfamily II DNA or RNA helicase/HKD family nuclease
MPKRASTTGSELFIVDNSDEDWKVLRYLRDWCQISRAIDVATGYFEIGSLLGLKDKWQKVDRIRILMGDEVSKRTKKAFADGLSQVQKKLDDRIEDEKQRNDFLAGVPAIVEAIKSGKIECRVYRDEKFHAKAYITHARLEVVGSSALVGSSNLTLPGLTENIELNVQITGAPVSVLQEWYEEHWNRAENVTPEILRTIERHTREPLPFEVYAKSLYEYLAGRELPLSEWDVTDSVVYPKLSKYQQDGYRTALKMAEEWGGALICDGVGLGKTYIGLMLIERFIYERKRVLLIVPKSAEQSVWTRNWVRSRTNPNPLLAHIHRREYGTLLKVRRHTDFGREGTISEESLQELERDTDVIIVDEAHHFRTTSANRSVLLKRISKGKKMFLLTATPVNNRLLDLYNLIAYFTPEKDHFAKLGIQDFRRIFTKPDREFEEAIRLGDWKDLKEVENFLLSQPIFRSVLIQRSRRYVKESELQSPNPPLFPERQKPRVVQYSLRKVYATIYEEIKQAFDRQNPFLNLALYVTESFRKGEPADRKLKDQQKVVGLIRTMLLKRLESSYKSFEASIEELLRKMSEFLRAYSPEMYQAWTTANRRQWERIREHLRERLDQSDVESEDEEEEDLPESERIDPSEYDMERLLSEVAEDMNSLLGFLSKITRRFYDRDGKEDPTKDDKLQQLLTLLTGQPEPGEPDIRGQKIIIFTEFRDTARYLLRQLRDVAGLEDVEESDSTRKMDREEVIKRFAPHYNCEPGLVAEYLANPINILISTDVLSEGLNLQDACLMVNYDLHWNPVRLMQRIGRVDRRRDHEIEARLKRPDAFKTPIYFWNFLPPADLEALLRLFTRITGKVLRINAALGIEGALLTPDDPEMTLKEFNRQYEGEESTEERMRRELRAIEQSLPELYASLPGLPLRLFSGKEWAAPTKLKPGLFCCYRVPNDPENATSEVYWFYREREKGHISDNLDDIWEVVKTEPEVKRTLTIGAGEIRGERDAIESSRVRKLMRNRGLPVTMRATLLCWLEVS